ncbi:MAG: inositol-3-phosphate synthase [Nitrosopumilaceae archaeon]|nr:inositol-3-phosphate synthase [Nitrosopumilaceae archaeon]
MKNRIRVGVVGIGNCFAGLLQGIEYYKTTQNHITGVIHNKIKQYTIFDIDFVSGFDVGKNKIGKKLSDAMYQKPNLVNWIPHKKMSEIKPIVQEAPVLDGVGKWVQNQINPITNRKTLNTISDEIKNTLQKTKTEIIVSYLPVGSDQATQFWANICLDTNTAFVNCIPSFIASNKKWAHKFMIKNIPLIGDDIKGQIGATILHRTIAKLCNDRGTEIQNMYQLNVGGNTDFLNMKEHERLTSKKISKTDSVQSQLNKKLAPQQIHVGPSDYISFLENTKLMFLRIIGNQWANIPYTIETQLKVDDKANSAGIVVDAIRLAKLSLDRKIGGPIIPACAYLMKHPPKQMNDNEAMISVQNFINNVR